MSNALHVLTKLYGGSVDVRAEHRYDSYIDNYVIKWTFSGTSAQALSEHLEDFNTVRRQQEVEKQIRNAVPAVQQAWENYQMLLNLSR
jgi:hypothetical protein